MRTREERGTLGHHGTALTWAKLSSLPQSTHSPQGSAKILYSEFLVLINSNIS